MRPQDVTIVVLGAGINGAAIARECALSGVSVVVAVGFVVRRTIYIYILLSPDQETSGAPSLLA